jgi:AraC-like DNA-binding protein
VYGHRVADFERCRWLAHGVSSGAALALYRLLRRHGDAAGADRARLPDVAVLGSLVARLFDVGQASPRHVPQERQAGWLRDARALLETDGEEPAMRDVARALGVHPVSLARRFRRQLACSPREYRQRWRVRRALALLATGAALPRVAQDAGFCDQSHLCRSFRRQLGMTPGAYRRLVGAA